MENKYRLHYSILLSSDISLPSDASDGTLDCIPGREIRRAVERNEYGNIKIDFSALSFSFAYIASNGKRCLPSPVSFAFVRNTPTQIRDRMAEDYYTDSFERVHYLPRCYITNPNSELIESVLIRKKTVNYKTVLCSEQSFIGFIEGERELLNCIAETVKSNCILEIGGGAAVISVLWTFIFPLWGSDMIFASQTVRSAISLDAAE